MVYADTNYALDYSVGVSSRRFSANGLYDPDLTGVGHQPRGFDQMMTLFDRYVVTGVRVEMWVGPTTPIAGVNTLAGIAYIEDVGTTPANMIDWLELPNNAITSKPIGNTAQPEGQYISTYYDLVKLKGHGKNRSEFIQEIANQGTSSANPDDTADIRIWAGPSAGTSTSTTVVRVAVRITYYTTFLQGKVPPVS